MCGYSIPSPTWIHRGRVAQREAFGIINSKEAGAYDNGIEQSVPEGVHA